MPERVYHEAKCRYNLQVSAHLRDNTDYLDWAATALFYAALHLVDAFLDGEQQLPKDERHPRKHSANAGEGNAGRGRNQLVQALLSPIRKEYRSLEEASRRARYDLKTLDDNALEKLHEQFQRLDQYVRMRLIAQGTQASA
jgi:hypothetical protein